MYSVGQKVCLWQIRREETVLRVLREVIVTITEIKTGVPGEFSRKPVSYQSLKGTDEHGVVYEKSWNVWPESQTDNFVESWTEREDGGEDFPFWVPREAVYVYSAISRANKRNKQKLPLVDESGAPIKPKGDAVYCEKHDAYSHRQCLYCLIDSAVAPS